MTRITTLTPLLVLLLAGCSRPDSRAPSRPAEPNAPAAGIAPPAAPAPPATVPAAAPADTAVPSDPADWRVTARGIGPLRAGMTRAEVEGALGAKLSLRADEGEGCAMTQLPGAPAGTALMVVNDTLVRVDVFRESTTATAEGARIGDTRDRIQSLYAGRVQAQPHKYTAGQYLVVPAPSDTMYQLLFETDENGRVTRYRAGRLPEVGWVEACS